MSEPRSPLRINAIDRAVFAEKTRKSQLPRNRQAGDIAKTRAAWCTLRAIDKPATADIAKTHEQKCALRKIFHGLRERLASDWQTVVRPPPQDEHRRFGECSRKKRARQTARKRPLPDQRRASASSRTCVHVADEPERKPLYDSLGTTSQTASCEARKQAEATSAISSIVSAESAGKMSNKLAP